MCRTTVATIAAACLAGQGTSHGCSKHNWSPAVRLGDNIANIFLFSEALLRLLDSLLFEDMASLHVHRLFATFGAHVCTCCRSAID
jgi:hypothetical protein